jgi:hypothetical protein
MVQSVVVPVTHDVGDGLANGPLTRTPQLWLGVVLGVAVRVRDSR